MKGLNLYAFRIVMALSAAPQKTPFDIAMLEIFFGDAREERSQGSSYGYSVLLALTAG